VDQRAQLWARGARAFADGLESNLSKPSHEDAQRHIVGTYRAIDANGGETARAARDLAARFAQ
jgi:hypothetical protein